MAEVKVPILDGTGKVAARFWPDEVTNLGATVAAAVGAEVGEVVPPLISAHATDTTDVHGIPNTALLETQTGAQSKANAAAAAAAAALTAHENDTTDIHGISNTGNLVYTGDARLADTRTPTDGSVTTPKIADGSVTSAKIADGTIVNADVSPTAGIDFSKLASGSALSVLGRASNSSGAQASIQAVNDGEVLRRSGTTLGFGTIATQGLADAAVTGPKIAGGSITDGHVAAGAGIAPSKIAGTAVVTGDARLSDARTPTAHKASHATGGTDALSPADIGAVPSSSVGANNGVASLDPAGQVPASQLGNATGGATGGGTDRVFNLNDKVITQNFTIPTGKNALSAGPITVDTGVTVTVPIGSTWTII